MTTASRKSATNIALKVAIVGSGHKQNVIARRAGIDELRLSYIVTGRGAPPTPSEKKALARVLKVPSSEIFEEEAVAS